jgi:hypothetical protein
MSDASDSEHGSPITRKGRLYRKRDVGKESKEKMIRYYNDPDKRVKLEERIKNYNETITMLQAKVKKLSEYLTAQNSPPERTETS